MCRGTAANRRDAPVIWFYCLDSVITSRVCGAQGIISKHRAVSVSHLYCLLLMFLVNCCRFYFPTLISSLILLRPRRRRCCSFTKRCPCFFFCFSFLKRQWGNLKLWRLHPQQSHRLRRLHCFKWEAFIGPSRFSSEETSRHLHLVYSFSPHLIAVISPSPLYRCTDKIKKLKTSTLARQRRHVVTQFGLTGRDIKTGTWSWWNRTLAFDEICWTSDSFVKRGC